MKWNAEQAQTRPRATVIVPASVTANLNLTANNSSLNTSSAGTSHSSALSRGILKKHRSLDEPPPHTLIVESSNLHVRTELCAIEFYILFSLKI